MSQTVSFVARDELAEWLDRRAEERMKSISAVCQDIVAAEYRRERAAEADKPDQSGDDGAEALASETRFDFASKREADAVRDQFTEHLGDGDDRRMKFVRFAEGTPGEVVEELERRSQD
jgi:alkanesulfonate monooxygenase SsuD/methylene tetrahydromethanopterin reductase-like flavin-dependent oxidoreductase (luciferase family)